MLPQGHVVLGCMCRIISCDQVGKNRKKTKSTTFRQTVEKSKVDEMIRKLNWIQSTCLIPNERILKVESISNGGLSTVVFSHCHTCRPRPFLHSSRFKTPILPSFTETRLRSNFCWSMLFDCKVLFFLKCIEN